MLALLAAALVLLVLTVMQELGYAILLLLLAVFVGLLVTVR